MSETRHGFESGTRWYVVRRQEDGKWSVWHKATLSEDLVYVTAKPQTLVQGGIASRSEAGRIVSALLDAQNTER